MQPHRQQVAAFALAKDLLRARRLTCALVAGVDEGVGLLKERLARAGVLDDTVTGIDKRKVVDAFSPRSLSSPRITAGCRENISL